MSNVSAAAAATAAGIGEAELSELESAGQVPKKLDWRALGDLIGMDDRKLAAIAAGWTPSEKDLSQWREFRVITTESGGWR